MVASLAGSAMLCPDLLVASLVELDAVLATLLAASQEVWAEALGKSDKATCSVAWETRSAVSQMA